MITIKTSKAHQVAINVITLIPLYRLAKGFFYPFFLAMSVCSFLCLGAEAQTYSELYDLHFKMKNNTPDNHFYRWRNNDPAMLCALPSFSDSVCTFSYNNRYPIIGQLELELEQRILLPIHKEKRGKVIFEGIGENLKDSYLVIEGLNYQEKKIFSDTLKLQLGFELKRNSKDILLEQVELLNLRFCIKGEKRKSASIGFSKIDILIGDTPIDKFPLRKWRPNSNFTTYTPIDLKSNKAFNGINIIEKKKIIGLGESIHRNSCINNLAYQFILEQVIKGNCKLILLEREMEKQLLYNRYIQGGKVEIEHKDPDFISFLENLRNYNLNKDKKEKVNLFGIDYVFSNSKNNTSFDEIFHYIALLNDTLKKKELDLFALSLIDEDRENALSFIHKNNEILEDILSAEDYMAITHILNLSHRVGNNYAERFILRDSIMYINTQFAVQNFCPQSSSTVIYAHSSHLNPVSTYPAISCRPLGAYLKQYYADDYSSLILLIGQGSTLVNNMPWGLSKEELSSPIQGSLEYLLNSVNESVIYCPTSDFDELMLVRCIGSNKYTSEFFPYNISQRHNGILFVKECIDTITFVNPLVDVLNKLSKDSQNNNSDKEKIFLEELEKYTAKIIKETESKNKNREKRIEEIKQRIKENTY